jgi:predicted nucleotidyltransferase
LTEPCPHALEALGRLVEARELRAALRLERVLADALDESGGDVQIAFVFGSTARLSQDLDSDIDLFVIGNLSLRQLSEPLDRAQATLGRRINPVIYDRRTLIDKHRAGTPFVQDVLRGEKIFLKGDEDGLGDLVGVEPASSDSH